MHVDLQDDVKKENVYHSSFVDCCEDCWRVDRRHVVRIMSLRGSARLGSSRDIALARSFADIRPNSDDGLRGWSGWSGQRLALEFVILHAS